jgi:hypothetical protein
MRDRSLPLLIAQCLAEVTLGDVMIIRSGLHGQRMEKRPSAFLSDDGGTFTAIAAGSIETATHARWRGEWLGRVTANSPIWASLGIQDVSLHNRLSPRDRFLGPARSTGVAHAVTELAACPGVGACF